MAATSNIQLSPPVIGWENGSTSTVPDLIGQTVNHPVQKTAQGLYEYRVRNYEPIALRPYEPRLYEPTGYNSQSIVRTRDISPQRFDLGAQRVDLGTQRVDLDGSQRIDLGGPQRVEFTETLAGGGTRAVIEETTVVRQPAGQQVNIQTSVNQPTVRVQQPMIQTTYTQPTVTVQQPVIQTRYQEQVIDVPQPSIRVQEPIFNVPQPSIRVQEPVIQAPVIRAPIINVPQPSIRVQEPVIQAPVIRAPVINVPQPSIRVQEPVIQAPVIRAPIINVPQPSIRVQEPVIQAPVIRAPIINVPQPSIRVQEPVVQAPVFRAPVIQEPVIQAPRVVVQEPIIQQQVVVEQRIEPLRVQQPIIVQQQLQPVRMERVQIQQQPIFQQQLQPIRVQQPQPVYIQQQQPVFIEQQQPVYIQQPQPVYIEQPQPIFVQQQQQPQQMSIEERTIFQSPPPPPPQMVVEERMITQPILVEQPAVQFQPFYEWLVNEYDDREDPTEPYVYQRTPPVASPFTPMKPNTPEPPFKYKNHPQPVITMPAVEQIMQYQTQSVLVEPGFVGQQPQFPPTNTQLPYVYRSSPPKTPPFISPLPPAPRRAYSWHDLKTAGSETTTTTKTVVYPKPVKTTKTVKEVVVNKKVVIEPPPPPVVVEEYAAESTESEESSTVSIAVRPPLVVQNPVNTVTMTTREIVLPPPPPPADARRREVITTINNYNDVQYEHTPRSVQNASTMTRVSPKRDQTTSTTDRIEKEIFTTKEYVREYLPEVVPSPTRVRPRARSYETQSPERPRVPRTIAPLKRPPPQPIIREDSMTYLDFTPPHGVYVRPERSFQFEDIPLRPPPSPPRALPDATYYRSMPESLQIPKPVYVMPQAPPPPPLVLKPVYVPGRPSRRDDYYYSRSDRFTPLPFPPPQREIRAYYPPPTSTIKTWQKDNGVPTTSKSNITVIREPVPPPYPPTRPPRQSYQEMRVIESPTVYYSRPSYQTTVTNSPPPISRPRRIEPISEDDGYYSTGRKVASQRPIKWQNDEIVYQSSTKKGVPAGGSTVINVSPTRQEFGLLNARKERDFIRENIQSIGQNEIIKYYSPQTSPRPTRRWESTDPPPRFISIDDSKVVSPTRRRLRGRADGQTDGQQVDQTNSGQQGYYTTTTVEYDPMTGRPRSASLPAISRRPIYKSSTTNTTLQPTSGWVANF